MLKVLHTLYNIIGDRIIHRDKRDSGGPFLVAAQIKGADINASLTKKRPQRADEAQADVEPGPQKSPSSSHLRTESHSARTQKNETISDDGPDGARWPNPTPSSDPGSRLASRRAVR